MFIIYFVSVDFVNMLRPSFVNSSLLSQPLNELVVLVVTIVFE